MARKTDKWKIDTLASTLYQVKEILRLHLSIDHPGSEQAQQALQELDSVLERVVSFAGQTPEQIQGAMNDDLGSTSGG